MSSWISVKDRLPDEYVKVLVCNRHGLVFIDFYHSSIGWGHDANLRNDNRTKNQKSRYITHWQPLPELPEI